MHVRLVVVFVVWTVVQLVVVGPVDLRVCVAVNYGPALIRNTCLSFQAVDSFCRPRFFLLGFPVGHQLSSC